MAPSAMAGKKGGKQATLGYHSPSPSPRSKGMIRRCENETMADAASEIGEEIGDLFGRVLISRKFFSTPAGYKPPPEPKTEKEDTEMRTLPSTYSH